jgi:hypothetical protein
VRSDAPAEQLHEGGASPERLCYVEAAVRVSCDGDR